MDEWIETMSEIEKKVTHAELIQKALGCPETIKEYNALDDEYKLLEETLNSREKLRKKQVNLLMSLTFRSNV